MRISRGVWADIDERRIAANLLVFEVKTMNSFRFGAVLLAGGKSSRMGRDKAGVKFRGEPLWRRQLATLQSLRPAEIVISGRAGAPYAASGYEVIVDDVRDFGPLAGIVGGMRRTRCDLLLLLAIDLPEMTADFLLSLLREAATTHRGVVPRNGRWFEPLAAVYTRQCLPIAEQCLASSDRSLQHFVREAIAGDHLAPRPITRSERPLFKNVNTEADLRS